jgi:hypothetical protein
MWRAFKFLFPCTHPAHMLKVRREETRAEIDGEFESVTYQLSCIQCGDDVNIQYQRLTGGPLKHLQEGFDISMHGGESVVHNIARVELRLPGTHVG